MQINPTTFCTYGNKKRWTQTFPYCNYGNKDRLLVQQASKLQNSEISSFVKELLFLFITTSWEKIQINPTTYFTYGNKKKRTHPDTYYTCDNTKKRIAIEFLLLLI